MPGSNWFGRAKRLQIGVLHQILGIGRDSRVSRSAGAVQAVEARQRLALEGASGPAAASVSTARVNGMVRRACR